MNAETAKLIDFMEKIISEGKNVEVFLNEAIKLLRDVLVLKTSNNIEGFTEKEINDMMNLVKNNDNHKLIYVITNLALVQGDMKWSSDSEVAFETGVLKVAIESNQGSASKIELGTQKLPQPSANNVPQVVQKSISTMTNSSVNIDSLKNQVLTKLKENSKMRICAVLQNAQIMKAEDEIIHIVFSNLLDDTSKQYLQHEETKKAIKEAVVEATQQEYKVKYVFNPIGK